MLSIVLFILSFISTKSDGPRPLTSHYLTAALAFSNVHTHTRTGISGPRPIRGGSCPSLSLIGLNHYMGLMCVCSWTKGRLSESRRLFFPSNGWSHRWDLRFFLVAPLRNWVASHSRALPSPQCCIGCSMYTGTRMLVQLDDTVKLQPWIDSATYITMPTVLLPCLYERYENIIWHTLTQRACPLSLSSWIVLTLSRAL